MKKLFILLFVIILILSVCGCGASKTNPEMSSVPSYNTLSSSEIVESVSRITEEEAIEIASRHWGIKSGDKDEKTGFPFLIMPVESGNDNIKIALKWLVNNQNYSTVDMVEIDPYSGKIVNTDTEE